LYFGRGCFQVLTGGKEDFSDENVATGKTVTLVEPLAGADADNCTHFQPILWLTSLNLMLQDHSCADNKAADTNNKCS
jgi:hypothetical protein